MKGVHATAKEIAELNVSAEKIRKIANKKSDLAHALRTIQEFETKTDDDHWPSEIDYETAKLRVKALRNKLDGKPTVSIGKETGFSIK